MSPAKAPPVALVAPGLGSDNPLLGPTATGPRSARRARGRPLHHVHLEVDLAPTPPDPHGVGVLERLEEALKERQIVEPGTLLLLTGATLHALSAQGFRRVDHWEVVPGGWLPPPPVRARPGLAETVGHLLDGLQEDPASPIRKARSFRARISNLTGDRVDLTLRWVHRERRHALSLDLWGRWTPGEIDDLEGALAERLPIRRSTTTRFQYA